jgi:hypothetical protein
VPCRVLSRIIISLSNKRPRPDERTFRAATSTPKFNFNYFKYLKELNRGDLLVRCLISFFFFFNFNEIFRILGGLIEKDSHWTFKLDVDDAHLIIIKEGYLRLRLNGLWLYR